MQPQRHTTPTAQRSMQYKNNFHLQVADLRDFDDLTEALPELENLELYQAAVKQLEVGIPYRYLNILLYVHLPHLGS